MNHILFSLFYYDVKRRSKDGFFIGYNIIFPIVMILLLGYLASGGYGKEFTGYHYYTIVMLPFCVSMAMITAAYAGKEEAYKKTAIRFLFTPISKAQIVLSKLLSCVVIISICNALVLVFAKLILKLPISDEFIPVCLLLLTESFCSSAIGLYIGLGMKNFILIKNVINIPICVAAILAGAFYPIGTLNQGLKFVIKLSPLTWINRSIFQYIYDENLSMLWITSAALIIVGVIFTSLAIKLFKREEFIHGDLPGYEK
jgi:ABC-2 type transport system permease protein